MMPAAKHGDPQLGVDVHLCVVPPSPSPVPLPTPHMSVVFDPMDYLPFIGATVTVCGMKRAVAGTAGQAVHIPPGFPFAPKLPDKDDELFMGSATVEADGDPFSFLGVPVLACQAVGMPSPPRPRRKGGPRVMMLPTVFNLAIPTNVFVGGPPTISLMGMAFKAGLAGLGKLARSNFARAVGARFQAWRKAKFGHLKSGFLKCTILRAEPVNIVTGAVSVEQQDFELPGLIPVRWTRRYASDNARRGACGVGWETPADARLEHDAESGIVLFHHPEEGIAIFPALPAVEGDAAAVLELMDGALLSDHGTEFRVRTKEDRIYRFPKSLVFDAGNGAREYPLWQVRDLCGNTLTWEREGRRLVALADSVRRRLELETGPDGLLRQVSLHVPESGFRHAYVRYEQDAGGDLLAVADALGNPYRFAYDRHHMVRHTDRNGLSFYYEFDRSGEAWRVVRSWGDGGLHAYRFAYLDAVNERKITDSLGHVSLVKLDERGLPISEIDPLGGVTIFEYDEAGRTTAVVDPDGHRTQYVFDERGNLLRLVLADGATTSYAYDAANRLIRTTDPAGRDWSFSWSARGELLNQSGPVGDISTFRYRRDGQLTHFAAADGATTEYSYDAYGNLTVVTDPVGGATRFEHDALGSLLRQEDPLGRATRHAYDAKGRLLRSIAPGASETKFTYDAEDNLTERVDEEGGVTRFAYCGTGKLRRHLQPDGHHIEFRYDSEERLTAIRNQRGEIHTLERDEKGRVVAETDYWGQVWRREFSLAGHLRRTTDPLGRTTEYTTDALGRVVQRRFADPSQGVGVQVERFEYDVCGNLIACENAHARIERTVDAEGRLLTERQGEWALIENAYDVEGRRTSRRIAIEAGGKRLAHAIRFEYDSAGRWSSIASGQDPLARTERDVTGQIVAERLPHDLRREYAYNADGQLVAQRMLAATRPLSVQRYARDRCGNVLGREDSESGREHYAYDAMGRLTSHMADDGTAESIVNDPAGDRLTTSIDAADGAGWRRSGSHAGVVYRFDRAGNLVERSGRGRSLRLVWDANQRLVESWSEGERTTYAYDPLGRRIAKCRAGRTTRFVWDGDALLGELRDSADDTATSNLREVVYRPGAFEPLALIVHDMAAGEGSEPKRYLYHNEPNGTPVRLLDRDGRAVWTAAYTGWGAARPGEGSTEENQIRLQGQYADEETGLHYNRHRYFDPDIGQFVSPDPLGIAAGVNLTAFAPNPWSWIDPLGLSCKWARTWTRKHTAAGRLPRFSGRSRGYVERQLRANGFTPDGVNPNHWWHPDGSRIRIDGPHNPSRGPAHGGFRGDVENHVHKEWQDATGGLHALDDYGRTNPDPNRTHIILK